MQAPSESDFSNITDPFRDASVVDNSSSIDPCQQYLNDVLEQLQGKQKTHRVVNQYQDTNLIEVIQPKAGAAIETQTVNESHSIACGDDNI